MATQSETEDPHRRHWDPEWAFTLRILTIRSMMNGTPLATAHPRDLPFSPSGMGESEHVMMRSLELIQKEKNRARTQYVLDTTPPGKFGIVASILRRCDEMNRLRGKSSNRDIFVRESQREHIEGIVHEVVTDQSSGILLQRLGFLPSEFEVDVNIDLEGDTVSGKIGVTAGPYSFLINLLDYVVNDDSEEDSRLQGFRFMDIMNDVEEKIDNIVSKWRKGEFDDPQIIEEAREFTEQESRFMEWIEKGRAKD